MKKHYTFNTGETIVADLEDHRKYSDDFIEGQMEKYAQRVKEIKGWIAIEEKK